MGYASSQYFTIPFLVLLKAIEKAKEGGEIFQKILGYVVQTCRILFVGNEEFRKNTIKMISDFVKSPDARTADIVPSVRVLIAQLYTFMTIENFQELYLKETDLILNKDTLQVFFRYAFEEQLRRNQKEDLEPPSKTVILKLLYPNYAVRVNEVITQREAAIRAEYEGDKSDDSGM